MSPPCLTHVPLAMHMLTAYTHTVGTGALLTNYSTTCTSIVEAPSGGNVHVRFVQFDLRPADSISVASYDVVHGTASGAAVYSGSSPRSVLPSFDSATSAVQIAVRLGGGRGTAAGAALVWWAGSDVNRESCLHVLRSSYLSEVSRVVALTAPPRSLCAAPCS